MLKPNWKDQAQSQLNKSNIFIEKSVWYKNIRMLLFEVLIKKIPLFSAGLKLSPIPPVDTPV